MNSDELKNAANLINRMELAFENVCGIAWENTPDADPDYLSDFERQMKTFKESFNSAKNELKKIL